MSFDTRVTLLEKLKRVDNDEAWSDFYSHYSSYISAVIYNWNINPSEVDDLVQKVMMISWEKIKEFEYDKSRGLFRSWLIRIARNTVMNFMKTSKRYDDKLKNFSDEQLAKANEQSDIVEKEWRVHISKLAWKSIRGNYDENAQNAFDLITQGRSNKEVAEALDLKQNTVAVYKKRITEALRSEIRRLDSFLA